MYNDVCQIALFFQEETPFHIWRVAQILFFALFRAFFCLRKPQKHAILLGPTENRRVPSGNQHVPNGSLLVSRRPKIRVPYISNKIHDDPRRSSTILDVVEKSTTSWKNILLRVYQCLYLRRHDSATNKQSIVTLYR